MCRPHELHRPLRVQARKNLVLLCICGKADYRTHHVQQFPKRPATCNHSDVCPRHKFRHVASALEYTDVSFERRPPRLKSLSVRTASTHDCQHLDVLAFKPTQRPNYMKCQASRIAPSHGDENL